MADKPFRAQIVNTENETAVWFGFDTAYEAQLFAGRVNMAIKGAPVSAIVGSYEAGATCPRNRKSEVYE